MYINAFVSGDFSFNGNPVPEAWIKRGRGKNGLCQRLEFGPSDAEPQFLDDILVEEVAGEPERLSSGYLVAERIEVGPNVVIGQVSEFNAQFIEVNASAGVFDCSQADVCRRVRTEKAAYESEHNSVGPRGSM
jgi:hypothetical protein